MSNENGNIKGFLLGVITGSIAGGLIALLYAPKSGRELRDDIGRKKDEIIDEAEKYIDKAKMKASGIIDNGKKKAEEFVSAARQKAETLTKEAGKIFTSGKERAMNGASQFKDAVRLGVESYKEEIK